MVAGHPLAIVIPFGGNEPVIVRQGSDVVGAFADAVFGVAELTLQPGDRIFLYTDGLIEAAGGLRRGPCPAGGACMARRELPLQDLMPAVVDDVVGALSPADDTLLWGWKDEAPRHSAPTLFRQKIPSRMAEAELLCLKIRDMLHSNGLVQSLSRWSCWRESA